MPENLPVVGRCTFPSGWTPKLGENKLVHVVVVTGKRIKTASNERKNNVRTRQDTDFGEFRNAIMASKASVGKDAFF